MTWCGPGYEGSKSRGVKFFCLRADRALSSPRDGRGERSGAQLIVRGAVGPMEEALWRQQHLKPRRRNCSSRSG
jgi:hypothetical protein